MGQRTVLLFICILIFTCVIIQFYSNKTKEEFTPYIRGKYRENARTTKKYLRDKVNSIQTSSTRFLRKMGFI